MHIRPWSKEEPLPLELLLDADPAEEKVRAYCQTEQVFLAEKTEKVVGVYILGRTTEDHTAEILNIAVAKSQQNQGLGKQLVQNAIEQATKQGFQRLIVGTCNSSIGQIAFYQKCGFELYELVLDFFAKNYSDPIVENGIPCKHLLRFQRKLDIAT